VTFEYYNRLNARQRAVYRKSDEITSVQLPRAAELRPLAAELHAALVRDERASVELKAQALTTALLGQLGCPDLTVEVLAVRPQLPDAELHGLYTPEPPGIRLWMRTAKMKRVVAFRTFLRTLLHELCHHLDFSLFRLEDSYHTEGFFKRESSLFHQLVPKG
jgi:hypothetical protein